MLIEVHGNCLIIGVQSFIPTIRITGLGQGQLQFAMNSICNIMGIKKVRSSPMKSCPKIKNNRSILSKLVV